MRTLLVSSTVLITILASLAFGIACGYMAVSFILRAMGHQNRVAKTAPASPIPASASSQ